MNTILTVIEELIRLFKREVHDGARLVSVDNVFEVTETPSVILQGPVMSENGTRRTQARLIEKDLDAMDYEECKAPRLYHLDFDVILTTATELELLDLQFAVARLYQTHPTIAIGDEGVLNLSEMLPAGGLRRLNLSNLRQASGRARIEDCPVYDGEIRQGKLIRDRIFDFHGALEERRAFAPED